MWDWIFSLSHNISFVFTFTLWYNNFFDYLDVRYHNRPNSGKQRTPFLREVLKEEVYNGRSCHILYIFLFITAAVAIAILRMTSITVWTLPEIYPKRRSFRTQTLNIQTERHEISSKSYQKPGISVIKSPIIKRKLLHCSVTKHGKVPGFLKHLGDTARKWLIRIFSSFLEGGLREQK